MEQDLNFWIDIGELFGGGKYPRAVTDESHWRDIWMRDDFTTSVLRVTFNPETGAAAVAVEKNTTRPEPTP